MPEVYAMLVKKKYALFLSKNPSVLCVSRKLLNTENTEIYCYLKVIDKRLKTVYFFTNSSSINDLKSGSLNRASFLPLTKNDGVCRTPSVCPSR